jgi:AcrR family transcriptional regulator
MRDKGIQTKIKNVSLIRQRQQQIFDAAVKLFSKKGFHSTTLREISKESGITLGSLYDYINSKEDILYIIQARATEAVKNTVLRKESNQKNVDSVSELNRLIDSELKAMDKYQDLILIIYQESHAMGKETLKLLLRSEREHLKQYEMLINKGIKEGCFKRCNVRMAANLIKMLIDTWVIKRWDLKGKVNIEEMRQGILDLVFHGILTGNEDFRPVREACLSQGKQI